MELCSGRDRRHAPVRRKTFVEPHRQDLHVSRRGLKPGQIELFTNGPALARSLDHARKYYQQETDFETI